ncbi:MAG: helix-turn-helix transcriptional regulator [Tractidigestivibacter sp.]|uniref:helix-turn-helix transcriptional regulator n=1 Tax=Tractidigestivibacter sp. TaxID=2847320 RepID=UPI003D92118E
MTKEETVAVQAALNYVGLPENDPLRTTIDQALSSTPVDNGIVLRALGGMRGHTAEADSLSACARAIADFGLLEFSYQGVSESASRERRVDPKALRVSGDHWILDGIDMDKRAMRHFRVDHMSDILQIPAEEEDEAAMVEDAPLRQVRVTFHNKSYLSIFDWPGARLISDGDDGTTIELPYFGGMWLPRRLAACGGTLTIYDEELKRRTTAYAQALLNQLGQKAPAQA